MPALLAAQNFLKTHKRLSPIGLDLSGERFRAVQFENKNGLLAVKASLDLPLPSLGLQSGRPGLPAHKIPAGINRTLSDHNFRGRQAQLAVDQRFCLLEQVTLPLLPAKLCKKALQLQLEKLTPPDNQRYSLSYSRQGLSESKKGPVQNYLLTACPANISRVYCAAIIKAGLYPLALEASTLSLLRSLKQFGAGKAEGRQLLSFLLMISASSAELLITHSGKFLFKRTLSKTVRDSSLADINLNQPIIEGNLSQLSGKGIDQDHRPVNPVRKDAQAISSKLQDALAHFYSHNKSFAAFKGLLFLAGERACSKAFTEALAAELKTKTHLIDPFMQEEPCLSSTLIPQTSGPAYCLAAGAALRGWVRSD